MKLLTNRGNFFVYESLHEGCVEVFLGPVEEEESEYITTVNKSLLPSLIAALSCAKEVLK